MWPIVIIITLLITMLAISAKRTIECFSGPGARPVFIASKQDFQRAISTSPFFARMTPVDLYARGATSKAEYMNTYSDAFEEFTPAEKTRLTRLISKIRYAPHVPWKFAKVSTTIEKGFPHTLEDVIVLTNTSLAHGDFSLTETLIHEKVHILQRKDPAHAAEFIKRWGFHHVKQITHPLKRNNPDLPEENYALLPNAAIMQLYNSDRPSSIADSQPFVVSAVTHEIKPFHNTGQFPSYVHQIEHPYEIMATMIAREYMDQNFRNHQSLERSR
jgi:hypothetical protein